MCEVHFKCQFSYADYYLNKGNVYRNGRGNPKEALNINNKEKTIHSSKPNSSRDMVMPNITIDKYNFGCVKEFQ